ncbi:MAG: hypothetical protein R2747_03170 [Pyrinomonadaceae bacterium]
MTKSCKFCKQAHQWCNGHNAKGEPCKRRPKEGDDLCWQCARSAETEHVQTFTLLQIPPKTEKKSDGFDEIAKLFYEAYEKTFGNISASCEYAGMSRRTYYGWMDSKRPEHLEFKRRLKEIRPEERKKDILEAKILEYALNGSVTAAIFTLKTQARDRGYGERPVNEMLSDKEKVHIILGQIQKRADEEGISFQDELRNYLELFEAKLKPEIREQLISKLK